MSLLDLLDRMYGPSISEGRGKSQLVYWQRIVADAWPSYIERALKEAYRQAVADCNLDAWPFPVGKGVERQPGA